MKNKKWLIICSIIIAILVYIYSFAHQKSNRQDMVLTINTGDLTIKALAVGNIIPRHSIAVTSSMPGIVATLFHREGDFIRTGEALLQIKPSPRPQDVAEATRNLEKRRVAERTTAQHAERVQQLVKKGFASVDEYAKAQREYKEALADRQIAEEKLALLQKGESKVAGQDIKSIIYSPIDGFILTRSIDIGDTVVPQTDAQKGNTLFTIANMTDLIFRGQVSELDAGKIQDGMAATITIGALPDVPASGTLTKIALQAKNISDQNAGQANTSTVSITSSNSPFNVGFEVEISQLQLPRNIHLRSGYSATADIIIAKLPNIVLVPERVLMFHDDKTWVMKVGKPNYEQAISIGASDGINAQVLSGLKAGDKVLDTIALAVAPFDRKPQRK